MMDEFYISIDIESFGPIPGEHSMVNLGAVAYMADGKTKLGQFDSNLQEIKDSVRDKDTMINFWLLPEQSNALKKITKNPISPDIAMNNFADWIAQMTQLAGNIKSVLVAYPSGFDFMFIYWYWHKFLKNYPPFWFRCVDIKSFASGKLGLSYSNCTKAKALSDYWPRGKHTHLGVDDAEEQIQVFFNLKNL